MSNVKLIYGFFTTYIRAVSDGHLLHASVHQVHSSPHVIGFSEPELQLYTGIWLGLSPALLSYCPAVLKATAHIRLMTMSTGMMSASLSGLL